jgi:hypothetical protein
MVFEEIVMTEVESLLGYNAVYSKRLRHRIDNTAVYTRILST